MTPEYSLIDALLARRSRRFGKGMTLDGGPLAHHSTHPAEPLTEAEEAALVFAAVGITGIPLGDLNFTSGRVDAGGGNILAGFAGRTAASGDAIQTVALVVINDEGAWYVRRPQDLKPDEIPELVQLARARNFVEVYRRLRVQLADKRVAIPSTMPFTPSFNRWDSNVSGTTYFLPILEASELYINVLLTAFSEELGIYLLDDAKKDLMPAGVDFFAESRGGYLHDTPGPKDAPRPIGYVSTVSILETLVMQWVSVEEGAILQNLSLMTQALGLGGFVHSAAHPEWLKQLGFSYPEDVDPHYSSPTFAQTMGYGEGVRTEILDILGYNPTVPTPVGLSRGGHRLMRSYCPPNYPSMQQAVMEFVERRYAIGRGIFRDAGTRTAWQDTRSIQSGIDEYSGNSIAATIDYCEFVYRKYGRFPSASGPITTLLAYQAHRIDPDFYSRFYRPEAVRPASG